MWYCKLQILSTGDTEIFEIDRLSSYVVRAEYSERANGEVYQVGAVIGECFGVIKDKCSVLSLKIAPNFKATFHSVSVFDRIPNIARGQVIKLQERAAWALRILCVISVLTDVNS